MKLSYNWLNDYFGGKLPKVEQAAKLLDDHAMEIESVEKVGGDTVIDAKTTPNLNHTCLAHRGVARELGAIIGAKPSLYSRKFKDFNLPKATGKISVSIDEPAKCRRYIGRLVENVKIGPSPKWLVEKLETLGQRSINNVVDATNFVMLEIGQPMHAFAADKIPSGKILVRNAKAGEHITTLDKKDVALDESVLLITDGEHPLAIAGVKGGNFAELDAKTKNIILESANFDPILVRKTAQKIKIQTDASKRYENEITPEFAGEAMEILTKLIVEIAGTKETKVGDTVDIYPKMPTPRAIGISAKDVENILGVAISEKDIADIFSRCGFEFIQNGSDFSVIAPAERLDLTIKEDLAEEIGRLVGYEKIPDIALPKMPFAPETNTVFAYKEKIRNILYGEGFSEVMNYTFVGKGDIELANPASPERKFLRTNLSDGLAESLSFNARNAELVGMPEIRIFEFGHVFPKTGEREHIALGIETPGGKKMKDTKDLAAVLATLSEKIGTAFAAKGDATVAEFDLADTIAKLSVPAAYEIPEHADANLRFAKISPYPFIVRDIAVFTPEGTPAEDVFSIIKKEAGELMVKNRLFDVFTKTFPDGAKKTSYAYRLVFQSHEKTLADTDANAIMERITGAMNKRSGWQVR